jgi:hypothetical protein
MVRSRAEWLGPAILPFRWRLPSIVREKNDSLSARRDVFEVAFHQLRSHGATCRAPRACSQLSWPLRIGRRDLWCAPLYVPLRIAPLPFDAQPPFAPVSLTLGGMRRHDPLARAPRGSHASADAKETAEAGSHVLAGRRARRYAVFSPTFDPVPVVGDRRRRAAPSTVQSQSPAWSSGRRACPRGCGASLRERTRRLACSAPCPRPALVELVSSFALLA